MSQGMQEVLTLLIVGGCLAFLVYQGVQTLRGRSSSCGAGGCSACKRRPDEPTRGAAHREVFFPVEFLSRRK